ncbi:MAG TPA: carboxypeptidase regulatory-like domain-containing protein, partial [Polyangiaceae bacterium]
MSFRSHVFAFGSLLAALGCSASSAPGGKAVGDDGGTGSGATGGTTILGGTGGNAGTIPTSGNGGTPACTETTGTSISGYVYDPAGKVPLYNVVVYVPVAGVELPPITEGASCEKCSGREARAVAVALTDASGHFVLADTPSGADVPLVMEVGKWRRRVTIPNVTACQDNVIEDRELTRLP